MLYRPYEYDRPLRGEDDVPAVLSAEKAARVAVLSQRFTRLVALEEQFYEKADIRPVRLSRFERLLGVHDTGKVHTHRVAPRHPEHLERAWRTEAVRAVVAAKIFALKHTSQNGPHIRPAHEPHLMKDFRQHLPNRKPTHAQQMIGLRTANLLRTSAALTPYAPVFLDYAKPDDPVYELGIPEALFAPPLECKAPAKPLARLTTWLNRLLS